MPAARVLLLLKQELEALAHTLSVPPAISTSLWALPLECPFSYLHVQAAKVVAENGKPFPGHLLSRLSQCTPSVRCPVQVLELGLGQAVAPLWFTKKHKLGTWPVQGKRKIWNTFDL